MKKQDFDLEVCEVTEVHEDVCRKVASSMPPEEEISDLADLFKVFGDSTRLKILFALFDQEVCVCDLA
ncbi:MAG: ArsR family transcriptional regulator, partial [Lachnospiraceae bacterium]|nr:ArsR family transcriptional regulator [Lachnospiraceae bacterium]